MLDDSQRRFVRLMGLALVLSSALTSCVYKVGVKLLFLRKEKRGNHSIRKSPEDAFAADEWFCRYYNIPTTAMSLYQSGPEDYVSGGLFNP